jgi:hypothetical protein
MSGNSNDVRQANITGQLLSRPISGLIAFAAGIGLAWLVITKSLPFVLAEKHPELAHWLDPGNPAALIVLADRARADLRASGIPRENASTASNRTAAEVRGDGALPSTPELAVAGDPRRHRIETLARAAIAVDPLNARAFSLLGELTEEPDQKRRYMKEAVGRSRREPVSVLWLMTDSFERNDFNDVIDKADILLRTQESIFIPEAIRNLATLAETPQARPVLVGTLSHRPPWRRRFFDALPGNVQLAGTPFELFVLLNEAGSPVTASEAAPYLEVLMRENLVAYAHDIWLQLAIDRDEDRDPFLTNSSFERTPSGLVFDWAVQRGSNSTVEFRQLPNGDERAVWFGFDNARVQFPELSQVLVLDPGRYRLGGDFRGWIKSPRGLRWEIRCWKDKVLAQTDMLFGSPKDAWIPFALEVEIPDHDDCRAQKLRLFHNARSASEQLMSGQMAFRHLTVTAIHAD